MIKIRVLGAALLAILAISSIAASAAQGETGFHSEIEKTFIYGEQEGENTFTTTAGKIKCKKATYDSLTAQVGTGSGFLGFLTTTWAVQPQYSECTAFGQKATIDNPPKETGAACDYALIAPPGKVTISGTPLPSPSGASDVACELKVTVPSGNCNVIINQQAPSTPTFGVTTGTVHGKRGVRIFWGVQGFTYKVDGAAGSICGVPITHTDGSFGGTVNFGGYKSSGHSEAEQVGVWYE